jgi:hypothetical protein
MWRAEGGFAGERDALKAVVEVRKYGLLFVNKKQQKNFDDLDYARETSVV